MKKLTLLFGICLFVLETSCAPALEGVPVSVPKWAETNTHPKYPPQWFIIGVGISTAGLQEAKDSARSEIAKQIQVQIKEKTELIVEEQQIRDTQGGEQHEFRSRLESKSESLVNRSLSGAQIIATAHAEGTAYALAVLDRRKLGAQLESELEEGTQTINRLSSDSEKFLRDGKVPPAIANLTQAYDISYDLLSKRALHRVISPSPLISENLVMPPVLLSDIRNILSNLRFSKVSGAQQTGRVGEMLAQELSVKLEWSPDQSTPVPVSGIQIRFKYGTGEKIGTQTTDENGMAALQPTVRMGEKEDRGQITAKPILKNIPAELGGDLPIDTVVFNYRIEAAGPFPVQLAVRSEDGGDVSDLERKLARVINELNYDVASESPILVEGIVSVTDEKEMGGIRPRTLVTLNLDVQIKDTSGGDILESFSVKGTGMGTSRKDALQKGIQRFKISKPKLSEALANCQDDYLKFEEQRSDAPSPSPPSSTAFPPTESVRPPTVSSSSFSIKTYALLAGVNGYDHYPRLVNPVGDIEAIDRELRQVYKCETTVLRDPTRQAFRTALDELADFEYGPNDQLLVFFSGHGWFDERLKRGFLALKDSQSLDEDRLRDTFVPHEIVRATLERLDCQHVLLVVDSCFSGTLDPLIAMAGHRSVTVSNQVARGEYIKRKLAYQTRRYITAGGKEYVPDGRPGQHSPFTRQFLSALRSYGGDDGILTLEELHLYLEKVEPQPRTGELLGNEPGSSFVLIAGSVDESAEPSAQEYGELTVHVTPNDAQVTVEPVGVRGFKVEPVKPGGKHFRISTGKYGIHITRSGYQSVVREVDVKAGEQAITITLSPEF